MSRDGDSAGKWAFGYNYFYDAGGPWPLVRVGGFIRGSRSCVRGTCLAFPLPVAPSRPPAPPPAFPVIFQVRVRREDLGLNLFFDRAGGWLISDIRCDIFAWPRSSFVVARVIGEHNTPPLPLSSRRPDGPATLHYNMDGTRTSPISHAPMVSIARRGLPTRRSGRLKLNGDSLGAPSRRGGVPGRQWWSLSDGDG